MDAPQADILTLREFFNVPFKHKRLILGIMIVALVIAGIYCIVAEPLYNAESKFIVRFGREKLAPISIMPQGSYNVLLQERSENVQDELEILKSPKLTYEILPQLTAKLKEVEAGNTSYFIGVIRPIYSLKEKIRIIFAKIGLLRKESEEERLYKLFRNALKISWQEDSNVVKLGFRWSNPEFAAFAANLYAKAYTNLRSSIGQSAQSLEFYDSQIKNLEEKLKEIEVTVLDFQKKHVVAETVKQKEILLSEQERMLAKLQDISLKLSEVELKKAEVSKLLKSGKEWIETPHIGTLGVHFTDLTSLDKKYFELKNQLDGMLQIFTPQAREVIHVEEQIKQLRKQKAESLINIFMVEASNLKDQKSKLEEEIEKNRQKLNQFVQMELEYQKLQRERKLVEEIYLLYKKKSEEIRITQEMSRWNIASVDLISPAIAPVEPYWPKKRLIMVLTLLASLVIGLVTAFVKDTMSSTFERESDFEKIGIRHISTVLEMKTPKRT